MHKIGWLGLALVLTYGSFSLGEEPEKKPVFVGCRPTASECRYSCPTMRFAAAVMPELCNPDHWPDRLACFCWDINPSAINSTSSATP